MEAKTSVKDHKKVKIRACLTIEYMSSEDEAYDDDEKVFLVKTYRSAGLQRYFDALDRKAFQMQTKRAKDQTETL